MAQFQEFGTIIANILEGQDNVIDERTQRNNFVRWLKKNKIGTANTRRTVPSHLQSVYVHYIVNENEINRSIYLIQNKAAMDAMLEEANIVSFFAQRDGQYEPMYKLFAYSPGGDAEGGLDDSVIKSSIKKYIAFLRNDPNFLNNNAEVANGERNDAPDTETDQDYANTLKLNTIHYGPPGTGKTYRAMRRAVRIIDGEVDRNFQERYTELAKNKRIVFTTFHQSYGYEEFIEGIRPTINNSQIEYVIRDGVFKQLCKQASEDEENNYVIIIDEINRGNITKIFGELITLIEPSKRLGNGRGLSAILPYSGISFGVPENVYIIGTMNTADRSIAFMDTALRRRFDFIEMVPRPDLLDEVEIGDINIGNILRTLNSRIEVLLDREHTLGHAYFWELKNERNRTMKRLRNIFKKKIIPILQEYFFDDYEKIRLILGDNQKVNNEPEFITRKGRGNIFGDNAGVDALDIGTSFYIINNRAFADPRAYSFLDY